MQVLFLGTGTSSGVPMIGCECEVCRSGDPRDSRLRPSIYVTMDDGLRVLVDTTPDLRTQALRHALRQVDAVLYTHAHADHVMGLDEIRRFNVLSGAPMPVYGDGKTLGDLRKMFGYAFDPGAPKGGGVPDLRLFEVVGRFSLGRQEVAPVPVIHGKRGILGFRFGAFAYLTDCNAIPDASFDLLRDLDVLVLDALRRRPHPTHFSVDEAVAVAQRVGASRTFFTHIAHDLGHAVTCASLPPTIALAHDGLSLEF